MICSLVNRHLKDLCRSQFQLKACLIVCLLECLLIFLNVKADRCLQPFNFVSKSQLKSPILSYSQSGPGGGPSNQLFNNSRLEGGKYWVRRYRDLGCIHWTIHPWQPLSSEISITKYQRWENIELHEKLSLLIFTFILLSHIFLLNVRNTIYFDDYANWLHNISTHVLLVYALEMTPQYSLDYVSEWEWDLFGRRFISMDWHQLWMESKYY